MFSRTQRTERNGRILKLSRKIQNGKADRNGWTYCRKQSFYGNQPDIKALTMQNGSLDEYKHNWNNERFFDADYAKILDMQQTAYKRMDTYEEELTKPVSGKSRPPRKAKRDELLIELENAFGYYRWTRPLNKTCFRGRLCWQKTCHT